VSLVLLDLDGTLTDSRVGITRSVQYALRQLGLAADDLDALLPYIGPPLRESFVAISGVDQVQVGRAILAYREYFVEKGILENVVYAGVPEMLGRLVDDGWRLAVATSKPTVFAERILTACGLRGLFEVVAGAELDGTRERKADVISFALESASHAPDAECVMVGDREHDIIGAKMVGIPAIGVTWGFGSAEELRNAGADLLIHQVPDLPAALLALRGVAPHTQ
jgi:phosphoglycolate phosphatase